MDRADSPQMVLEPVWDQGSPRSRGLQGEGMKASDERVFRRRTRSPSGGHGAPPQQRAGDVSASPALQTQPCSSTCQEAQGPALRWPLGRKWNRRQRPIRLTVSPRGAHHTPACSGCPQRCCLAGTACPGRAGRRPGTGGQASAEMPSPSQALLCASVWAQAGVCDPWAC